MNRFVQVYSSRLLKRGIPSLSANDYIRAIPPRPCELMDNFAIGVQILLGTIAILSLLFKRQLENPRRDIYVWICDASKQALGAGFVHSMNVIVSIFAGSAPGVHSQNPCVYYFLNVGIDCTLGVLILALWLRGGNWLVKMCGEDPDMVSGQYGIPPRFLPWLKQTLLFSFCLFLMKLCVTLMIAIVYPLEWFASWVLRPFHDPRVEVVFVMLIFPLIMNVLQFWLVDGVIRAKPTVASGSIDVFTCEDGTFRVSQDLFTDNASEASLVTNPEVAGSNLDNPLQGRMPYSSFTDSEFSMSRKKPTFFSRIFKFRSNSQDVEYDAADESETDLQFRKSAQTRLKNIPKRPSTSHLLTSEGLAASINSSRGPSPEVLMEPSSSTQLHR